MTRILLTLAVLVALTRPALARVGDTLAEAERHAFVTKLGLTETGRVASDDGPIVTFALAPKSAFHDAVVVQARLGAGDRIAAMSVRVDRRMIDDPPRAVFAAKVVQGLLLEAAPAADEEAMRGVVAALEAPRRAAPPDSAAGVYVGRGESYAARLRGVTLRFENAPRDDGRWLHVAVVGR